MAKNSPSGHHRITLSGYILQLRHISTIGKIVKQQYLLHMSRQYGELRPLAAEIHSVVLGTAANFNGSRVSHGNLVVGVSQTLRR